MTTVLELENKNLKDALERTRKQRDQYGTSYKKLRKEYKVLEQKYEIVVAHNLIHMKQKADLQSYILDIETNAYLAKLDKDNLLKW